MFQKLSIYLIYNVITEELYKFINISMVYCLYEKLKKLQTVNKILEKRLNYVKLYFYIIIYIKNKNNIVYPANYKNKLSI